jgi:hypothetical protein
MPNVIVSDLSFHHRDQILTAATFGRGFWRLKVREPFPITLPLDLSIAADDPLAAGLMRDPSIPAPQLSSPDDGAKFSNFPRTTTLEWHPVTGAIAYTVDVFSGGTGNSYSSEQSSVTFDFWGAGEATWRVWAIFPESRRSLGSAMRSFKYFV